MEPPLEERAQLSEEEMNKLSIEMRTYSMLIKDRAYHLKKFPKCFVGFEAVNFFMNNTPYASTVEEAEKVGQQLMDADIIHHVTDAHEFKNENLFYRFREDEENKQIGPSVAKVTKEGTVSVEGYMDIKGTIFWNKRYFVLRADEMRLYYFVTHLSSQPSNVLDLSQVELEIAECSCKTGSYCFTVKEKKTRVHVICADHSKVQLAWLQALTDIGVKFKEENIKTEGNTIFDFSANDIDGNLVPLSNYAGNVCLVVNVASF